MQKSIQISRINWIDWAKTFGIFLVVVGHVYFPGNIRFLGSIIYGFHIPFFLIISGMLHKQEISSIKKSILRLLVPFFSFNVLFLILFYIPEAVINKNYYLIIVYLKQLLIGSALPLVDPTWFLFALFWAKLVNNFILKMRIELSIFFSILIAFFSYLIYTKGNFYVPFFICQGFLAVPFVTLGYYLKKFNLIELVFRKKKLLIGFCLVFLPIYIHLVYILDNFDFRWCKLTANPFLGIVMSLIGSCLFILFCRLFNNWSNRFVIRISGGTIVILAIHFKLYYLYLDICTKCLNVYILLYDSFFFHLLIPCIIMIICYFIIGLLQKSNYLSFLFLGKLVSLR